MHLLEPLFDEQYVREQEREFVGLVAASMLQRRIFRLHFCEQPGVEQTTLLG